jgi:nicotinamide N-methyltransferase
MGVSFFFLTPFVYGRKRGTLISEIDVWGTPVGKILGHIQQPGRDKEKFDVLVLADLLFRHSEHDHLLDSIEMAMKVAEGSKAFVVFTSYRPWLQHKDLKFFDLARERGFVVEKVLEKKMDRPLFENDPGDEEVRKTVTGWFVTWPKEYVEGRMEWPGKREKEE